MPIITRFAASSGRSWGFAGVGTPAPVTVTSVTQANYNCLQVCYENNGTGGIPITCYCVVAGDLECKTTNPNCVLFTGAVGSCCYDVKVSASNALGYGPCGSSVYCLTSGFGQVLYNCPGTYTWTVPVGVTTFSVVGIAPGGGGYCGCSSGGGALGYASFNATPGENWTVKVSDQPRFNHCTNCSCYCCDQDCLHYFGKGVGCQIWMKSAGCRFGGIVACMIGQKTNCPYSSQCGGCGGTDSYSFNDTKFYTQYGQAGGGGAAGYAGPGGMSGGSQRCWYCSSYINAATCWSNPTYVYCCGPNTVGGGGTASIASCCYCYVYVGGGGGTGIITGCPCQCLCAVPASEVATCSRGGSGGQDGTFACCLSQYCRYRSAGCYGGGAAGGHGCASSKGCWWTSSTCVAPWGCICCGDPRGLVTCRPGGIGGWRIIWGTNRYYPCCNTEDK